jgi:hypothetical protein
VTLSDLDSLKKSPILKIGSCNCANKRRREKERKEQVPMGKYSNHFPGGEKLLLQIPSHNTKR